MPVEVLVMEGKGNMQITGKIGEIMQESAQAALSYVKSRADDFDIDPEEFEKIDIHIHIPEGAIQKDGPSAGITICLALISALTRREVTYGYRYDWRINTARKSPAGWRVYGKRSMQPIGLD